MALWNGALKALFPVVIPDRCVWTRAEDIVAVLNRVGGRVVKNDDHSSMPISHTFMPTGGGIHSRGAKLSAEVDCIELLSDGSTHIVKPQSLTFESFGSATAWAYFRLEIDPLKATGLYDSDYEANVREPVTKLSPGNYAPHYVWEQGFAGYDENGYEVPLPEDAIRAFRYFSGAFVIFAESSPYNADPSTYDARHNKMSPELFWAYILRSIGGMPPREESEA